MTNDKGNARNHSQYWDDEDEILSPEAFAVHPGQFLKRNVLTNISVSALADHIGMARPGFTNMLNGKRALTSAVALKIEKAIGYPAMVLCQMQATYDLAHDRVELEPEIEHIERIAAYA